MINQFSNMTSKTRCEIFEHITGYSYDPIHGLNEINSDEKLMTLLNNGPQIDDAEMYLRIFHKTKSLYKEQYRLYLQSDEWRDKREVILERDNYQCRICGDTNNLEVHHLTYDRVYNESDYDLVTVCADCHEIIHKF